MAGLHDNKAWRDVAARGRTTVKSYRIYAVARSGRLRLCAVFEARDDVEAQGRLSVEAPTGEAVELWEGGRLVGHRSTAGAFSRGA